MFYLFWFFLVFFFGIKIFLYILIIILFSFFLLEGLAVSDTDHNKSGQKTGEKGIYILVMKM